MFDLFSVRDVVAGNSLTIIRTDTEDVYYFGLYNDTAYRNPSLASGNLLPRDLMARGLNDEETRGVVKLGC